MNPSSERPGKKSGAEMYLWWKLLKGTKTN